MSMLFFSKKSLIFLKRNWLALFLISFVFSNNALAWSGFDHENNTTIDISDGNLVREGLTITIYDWKLDEDHDVDVLDMQDSFHGTRLEVMDLETNKKRVFEMDE